MSISSRLRKIYFDEGPLTARDYEKSRNLFIFEGAAARTIFVLTSGAYMAGFAKYLGASDQLNGIIAAMPLLSAVIQVFSPMVFEKLERRKFLICLFSILHRLLLGLIVFVPFLSGSTTVRLGLIAGLYFLAYAIIAFVTPPVGNWIVSLTDENTRGRYFGVRDSYILGFVTVITLIMGRVLDLFKAADKEFTGFLISFIFVILVAIFHFYFISSVKEPPVRTDPVALDFKSIMTIPFKDRIFRKVIIVFFLWNLGLQIGAPFFAVYMVTGLKLDYTYIMVMGLLGNAANIFIVRYWGKLADRKSWSFATKMSIGLLSAVHLLWAFVDHETGIYLIPIVNILGGFAWAGINIALFNIQFAYLPQTGRTIYLGFNAALGGLVGFLSALAGSVLIGILQNVKLVILGVEIGNLQIIFGISGILLAVCAVYIHMFLKERSR